MSSRRSYTSRSTGRHGYGNPRSHPQRSRTGPEAKKYVLLSPSNIPQLSATLGIPGYFPHAGKNQDEEKMTVLNVINGYQRPSVVPDEYASYVDNMHPLPTETFQNKLDENINHIGWIKNFSRSWVAQRTTDNDYRRRNTDHKFPIQVPVTGDSKQIFMRDLASDSYPFDKLVQTGIPHGYKGENLINELATYQVPMLRATWFIKIVQLNARIQSHKRNKEDWTEFMTNSLLSTIKELGSVASVTSKSSGTSSEKDIITKLEYIMRLLHWNFDEKLLNSFKLFRFFTSAIKDSNEHDTTILLYILTSYLRNICSDHIHISTLISVIFSKLHKMEGQASKSPLLYSMLCDYVRFFLVQCPEHVTRMQKDDVILHANAKLLENQIDSSLPKYMIDQLIKQFKCVLNRQTNPPNVDTKQTATGITSFRHELNRAAFGFCSINDFFEVFKKQYDTKKRTFNVRSAITILCEWAVSYNNTGIKWRIFIVLRVLKRFHEYLKSKSPLVSQEMMYFLQHFKSKENEYRQKMLLYGEAQRSDLFSHDIFSRYLISTGAVTGKTDTTIQLLNYLHHMPVHGQIHQHNQRAMLLQQSSSFTFDRNAEKQLIETLGDCLQNCFYEYETSNAANCSEILLSLPDSATGGRNITHIAFVFDHLTQYLCNLLCSNFLENLMQCETLKSQGGCTIQQFQFALFIFEYAQDFSCLSEFIIRALQFWKQNFPQVMYAIKKYLMFFYAQEILQKLINLLIPYMNASQTNDQLVFQFIAHLTSMKLDEIGDLSIPPAMKIGSHSYKSWEKIHSDPLRDSETKWNVIPDLLEASSNTTMRTIAKNTSIQKITDLSNIFGSLLLQLIQHKDELSQPIFELSCNFLNELQANSSLPNHSEWFCKQLTQEFIPFCVSLPATFSKFFTDSQTAAKHYTEILSDFIIQLTSRGYISLHQFFKSAFLRLLSQRQPELASPLHKIFHRCFFLGEETKYSFTGCDEAKSSIQTELNLLQPNVLLQVLCGLFKGQGRDNPIFQDIAKSQTINNILRPVPATVIRSTFRQIHFATPGELRFAFHSIFFGNSPFLPLENSTTLEESLKSTLEQLLSNLDFYSFELVKLGFDYMAEDWKSREGTDESVLYSLVTSEILRNIATTPEKIELFCSLIHSIGKNFELILLAKVCELLEMEDTMFGKTSLGMKLSNGSPMDEEMEDVDNPKDSNESFILEALEILIVSCISSHATEAKTKLLNSLGTQFLLWKEKTKNIDICDPNVSLGTLHMNLLFRFRLLRHIADLLHLEKYTQNAEKFAVLLLQLCENPVVLYCDDEEDLFEFIIWFLDTIFEPMLLIGRVEKSLIQAVQQLQLHLRKILETLDIEGKDYARLDRVLPPVDTPGQPMIVFVCSDKSKEPKDVVQQLDPWTLLESYSDGQLSPAYFSGRQVERANLTYFKSPFDPPPQDVVME